MVENILGKGENAGYQHFLLFPKCFQKPSSLGFLKVGILWERVKESDCLDPKLGFKAMLCTQKPLFFCLWLQEDLPFPCYL